MMENYAAPQIELIRFDVYDLMTASASDPPDDDIGGDIVIPNGEPEPW